LVNSKNLINSSTFIKTKINNYIEAKITSFLIIRYNTYIIKNVINKSIEPHTIDLILYNIIVIKGFYINIIFETYLIEKKA
jgi:thiamine kinase-like enzyme